MLSTTSTVIVPEKTSDDWGRQVLELTQLARKAHSFVADSSREGPLADAWADALCERCEALLAEMVRAGVATGENEEESEDLPGFSGTLAGMEAQSPIAVFWPWGKDL